MFLATSSRSKLFERFLRLAESNKRIEFDVRELMSFVQNQIDIDDCALLLFTKRMAVLFIDRYSDMSDTDRHDLVNTCNLLYKAADTNCELVFNNSSEVGLPIFFGTLKHATYQFVSLDCFVDKV
ncbi:MAG: hypothetical protein NC548_11355 [Lachnospiraceae bacterium]|nr:hypothetical protein [Lachnospiraceae bacterium]